MPTSKTKQFILDIAPLIQKEAVARDYKVVSPIIAQACIESAYGTSLLSSKYHNYFGLKCGKSWEGKSVNLKTKEEYTVGTLTTISDNFRVYDSMVSGVTGYFDFINTTRYANLKKATTPTDYLEKIKVDGYCTSSRYVENCMGIIRLYNLTQYDSIIVISNPYKLTESILKRGSKGESVKWLQYELSYRYGYSLEIDGEYGAITEAAVRNFQTKKFVDGICGELTLNKLKAKNA